MVKWWLRALTVEWEANVDLGWRMGERGEEKSRRPAGEGENTEGTRQKRSGASERGRKYGARERDGRKATERKKNKAREGERWRKGRRWSRREDTEGATERETKRNTQREGRTEARRKSETEGEFQARGRGRGWKSRRKVEAATED